MKYLCVYDTFRYITNAEVQNENIYQEFQEFVTYCLIIMYAAPSVARE